MVGEGRSADYVEVLRGVRFVHRRPGDMNTRTFRLTCIELKDHYASNQLAVQVCCAVCIKYRVLWYVCEVVGGCW